MQFLLYCLCGGLGVSADYAVFWISVSNGIWYQTANVFGYLAGALVSFTLNRLFTFNMRDRVVKRFFLFLVVASFGFAASVVLLWLLVELFGLDSRLAKLITLPVVVAIQFSMNRRVTFGGMAQVPDSHSNKSKHG